MENAPLCGLCVKKSRLALPAYLLGSLRLCFCSTGMRIVQYPYSRLSTPDSYRASIGTYTKLWCLHYILIP
jgi:hypothetical protein